MVQQDSWWCNLIPSGAVWVLVVQYESLWCNRKPYGAKWASKSQNSLLVTSLQHRGFRKGMLLMISSTAARGRFEWNPHTIFIVKRLGNITLNKFHRLIWVCQLLSLDSFSSSLSSQRDSFGFFDHHQDKFIIEHLKIVRRSNSCLVVAYLNQADFTVG